jgi:hypothetical protein
MQTRPGDSPQRSGRLFEDFFAKLLGVRPTKGSGNSWLAKLDVLDGTITWSLKWTKDESIRISKALLREADQAVHQNGDNSIPGIAVAIDEGAEIIVAMRWSDFQRLMAQNPDGYIKPSKADAKRALAKKPLLFRETDA